MNNPVKKEHPKWMSEDDIAIYDQLMSMGRLQLGKELAMNEEFLLDLSAMITLKQLKGMMNELDDATIAELKRVHQEHLEAGLIFTTPVSEWYESARALEKPYLPEEVEKEINEANAMTSNLVIDKSTSNIADESNDVLVVEDGVAKIKEGWVKLVEPTERPEPVAEAVEAVEAAEPQ